MGLVDPKFDFSFDVLAKGLHIVEVKEASIEPAKEGKTSGKRYWVRLAAVGGDQDGVSHIESFFEITKNDFSFSKMAGFLYKLGVIKALGGYRGKRWQDISVSRHPSGAPAIVLAGNAKDRADVLGITRALITVTHERTNAVALAVAVTDA